MHVYVSSYIDEFMWRHINELSRVDAYEEILNEIGKYYPADGDKLGKLDKDDDNGDIIDIDNDIGVERNIIDEEQEQEQQEEDANEETELYETLLQDEEEFKNDNDEMINTLKINNTDSNDEIEEKWSQILLFFESFYYRFEFEELDASKRKLLHNRADESSLFHWTISDIFCLSNMKEDEELFKKYNKKRSLEDKVNDKITDLDNLINNLSIQNVRKQALNLEKESFKMVPPTQESVDVVNSVLSTKSNVQCDICLSQGIEKFCSNEWGLKVHKSKMHK